MIELHKLRRPWPGEDRYTAAQAVHWLAPRELLAAGVRAAISKTFGDYADRRETLALLTPHADPARSDMTTGFRAGASSQADADFMIFDETSADAGFTALEGTSSPADTDFWFDYVADLGDGFDATYTVAECLARDGLTIEGEVLPRGRILIMGGDEVYPTPSDEAYRNRTVGPYETALQYLCASPTLEECKKEEGQLTLYAIPGNHDWYDGLSSFIKQFCTEQWIGAWRTRQYRTYFSIKLPHRWWLWGIDTAFETRIDRPQMAYFLEARNLLESGDGVIICTAKPTWLDCAAVGEEADDREYHNLRHFITRTLKGTGAHARVLVAGDKHVYARYEESEAAGPVPNGGQKIVAGGGGAYLSATTDLAERLRIRETRRADPTDYTLATVFPSAADSRRLHWTSLWRLPQTWSLVATLGVFYLLIAYLLRIAADEGSATGLVDVIDRVGGDGFGRVVTEVLGEAFTFAPFYVLILLLLVAATTLANKGHKGGRSAGIPFGMVHTAGHMIAALFTTMVAFWAGGHAGPSGFRAVTFFLVAFVLGAVLSTLVFTLYLILAAAFGRNLNELFIGIRWKGYKNFLRFRIDEVGDLHVYALGLQKVRRRRLSWDADGHPEVSGQAASATLIDSIVVPRTPDGTSPG